ncbi:MAG: hypothetical protein K0S65_4260, partial [Labilithrix sp.]|nr:hypothetical protein [Labilithrix sp.]
MPSWPDRDETPFPLVQRHAPTTGRWPAPQPAAWMPQATVDTEAETDEPEDTSSVPEDRMSPAVSGGVAGILAGLAALGVVHGLASASLTRPIVAVADARGVDLAVAFGIAYATAGAVGALVGATYAVVTRYLRRWGPLVLWGVVFFG